MSTTERLYTKIATEIVSKIKRHEIKVGDRIPPERKLAEDLNVSRTVIREAMVYLELIGVAEIRKGSGVYITESEPRNLPNSLPDTTPFEVLEARMYLESQLAKKAAENPSESFITALQQCLQMMEASTHFSLPDLRKSASVDADRQFHFLIAQASENTMLIEFHKELMSRHMGSEMWKRMDVMADEPAERGIWTSDHQLIFDAIKEKNPAKAYLMMERHLKNVIAEIT